MKKVILTILIIILISLLGLIAYQYFNNDNEEEIIVDENVEINNGTFKGANLTIEKLNYLTDEDKIDSSKPFIYSIMPLYDELTEYSERMAYRQYKNEFVNYKKDLKEITSIPYININVEDVDKINYMLKAYCLSNYQSIYDLNANDEDEFFTMINVYNDILSIFVTGVAGETRYNLGINIDLKNKKILSLDDMMKKLSITDSDLKKSLEENHNKMKDENPTYYESSVSELVNRIKLNSKLEYKIFKDEININKSLNDYAKMNHSYYTGTNEWMGYTITGWGMQHDGSYSMVNDLVNNQKVCYYINEDNKLTLRYYYKQIESSWVHDTKIIIK